jgi:formate hydrogenlyase subunit 6/NADH:ubiquinone oxidoreductase subunit I
MPSQIVVVKRSQRYAFAAPRSAPAWLRALWTGVFRATRSVVGSVGPPRPWTISPRVPRLVRDAERPHRCVGCGSCVTLCPSRSLQLDLRNVGEAVEVARFELDLGSCIGCGLCDVVCPEQAIGMTIAPRIAVAPDAGRRLRVDLLAIGA